MQFRRDEKAVHSLPVPTRASPPMTNQTVEIYGRGYLGNLSADALSAPLPNPLATPNPLISASSERERHQKKFAVIASGPSSVATPQSEMMGWRGRLELWIASHQHRFEHVIYFSSAGTVYGEMQGAPHIEAAQLLPENDYGKYHVWAESRLIEALKDRLTILRLANIYGPKQRMKSGQGFITAAVRDLETKQPLTIYGDGSLVRDYIHEADVVTLIKAVHGNPRSGIFNVASGIGTEQRSVIKAVEKSFRKTLQVNYCSVRSLDVRANVASIEKAQSVFGWKVSTNLQAGIETYKESH